MAKIKRSKPHPRFGATKAQGKHNQQIRDLCNEIYALKVERDVLKLDRDTLRNRCQVLDSDLAVQRGIDNPVTPWSGSDSALRVSNLELQGRCAGLTEALRILATGKVTP